MLMRLPCFVIFAGSLALAQRPISVCEALESARDRQEVIVYGEYLHGIEFTVLGEPGLDGGPCPSHRGFAIPSVLVVYLASVVGMEVSRDKQITILRKMYRPNHAMVTAKAVFVRPWGLS